MPRDYYMKLVGKCTLKSYLEACSNKIIEDKNETWFEEINSIFKYLSSEERLEYFSNIKSIIFTDYILYVTNCNYNDECSVFGEEIPTFLFYEYLLQAIEEKDPEIKRYYKVFTPMEELHITRNGNIKFDICNYVNHKGAENLDIDYSAIHKQQLQVKKFIPSIKIYTVIGQN